jgi:hypothetical protein
VKRFSPWLLRAPKKCAPGCGVERTNRRKKSRLLHNTSVSGGCTWHCLCSSSMSGNKRIAAIDVESTENRGRAQSNPVGTYAQQREAKRLAAVGTSSPTPGGGRAALSNGGNNGGRQRHANWSESEDRPMNSSTNMSRTDPKALVAKMNVFANAKRRIKKLAPRTQLNMTFAVIELFMIAAFILQSTASSTAVYQNYSASATDAIGAIHEVRTSVFKSNYTVLRTQNCSFFLNFVVFVMHCCSSVCVQLRIALNEPPC